MVEEWKENVYFQFFSVEQSLRVCLPCTAIELVLFLYRIGEEGIKLILHKSIRENGDGSIDKHESVDTTVRDLLESCVGNNIYLSELDLYRIILIQNIQQNRAQELRTLE